MSHVIFLLVTCDLLLVTCDLFTVHTTYSTWAYDNSNHSLSYPANSVCPHTPPHFLFHTPWYAETRSISMSLLHIRDLSLKKVTPFSQDTLYWPRLFLLVMSAVISQENSFPKINKMFRCKHTHSLTHLLIEKSFGRCVKRFHITVQLCAIPPSNLD